MLVIKLKIIYSFETAMYNFAPYFLFLIDKQVFFSVTLLGILKDLVNNHTLENNLVPVYFMTASGGNTCVPAFLGCQRTTYI